MILQTTGVSTDTNDNEAVQGTQQQRVNFRDGNRTVHLAALYEWLPEVLHHAPNIDWTKMPSAVIAFLIRTVGTSPDAPYIALALGTMAGAVGPYHLRREATNLHSLLKMLRSTCAIEQVSQLANKQIWAAFVAEQQPLSRIVACRLLTYSCLTDRYLRHYLEELDEDQRIYWKRYVLPPLPVNFVKQHDLFEIRDMGTQQRRKEQSDVLVALYPVLVQIVQFRKQAAQRLLHAFHEAQKQVTTGNLALPYSFVHEETIPEVNRDARTIAEVKIVGRPVTMHLTLWDRRSWVIHHPDRYHPHVVRDAKRGKGSSYESERNVSFLQFHGEESELLWFGDLVKDRLLQRVTEKYAETTDYQNRRQRASDLGVSEGYACDHPGLLSVGDDWFSRCARPGEILFEAGALYRGVLYGAALATIALTNGSRMNELLQVSADRWDTIVVDQLKEGKPTGKKVTLMVQYLLAKGSQTAGERQLFPMSKQSVRLLKEIYEGLIEFHGEIPVIAPNKDNRKFEQLQPERYLFQWRTNREGQASGLSYKDVTKLLRFVLHGLELSTTKGEPIRVSAHLLRHVTATHARFAQQVPPEVLALLLHHRMEHNDMERLPIPVATQYYTRQPLEWRLATLHAMQAGLDELSTISAISPPTERDLEQMNDDIRAVFERWGTILPTVFGNCGCPGLCIRGDQRALCIGCSYLVVDPSKMEAALKWRDAYARQADELAAEGNRHDARQKCQLVQQLDGHINIMYMQIQAEADGHYIPSIKVLSESHVKMEKHDGKDS